MAIKEEFVTAKWHGKSRKHYEDLGYIWGGNHQQFKVRPEHLSPSSEVKVTAICEICSIERVISFSDYKELCHACAVKISGKNPESRRKNLFQLRLQVKDKKLKLRRRALSNLGIYTGIGTLKCRTKTG